MIRIAAIGDIILGDHPLYCGIGVRSKIEKQGLDPFKFVKLTLKQCDIVIGNLETVLSNEDEQRNDYYSFQMRGNKSFVSFFKEAKINVVNVANNHILQHGFKAMQETIELLKKNSIHVIGIPKDNKKLIEIKGEKIGILGYSFRPEQFFENKQCYEKAEGKNILNNLYKIKKTANYIIISLHWGEEYMPQPSSWQITLAHRLIDEGADIILGHHPHVLQPIEVYKGKIIAYSLGNFVSDMCQELAKKSLILKIELSNKKIIAGKMIPCYINNDYQPVIVRNRPLEDWFPKTLKTLDKRQYKKKVAESIKKFRKEFYVFFMKKFYKYPPRYLFDIFLDFLKRIPSRL